MKVCLISPPTLTDFADLDITNHETIQILAEHAPVGILSLAAVLEQRGICPQVLDLNQMYFDFLRGGDAELRARGFFNHVVEHLKTYEFDIFGLGSICSSYPLTLRLCEALKQQHPESLIILGGPQASVVDVPTLRGFAAVDIIVRGEAEETFPTLIERLASGSSWTPLPGVTYRRNKSVARNPNAPVIEDLDSLPTPAYHLFPSLKTARYVALELGRGCPFACRFCSTNDFFRRNFRLKSPKRLIGEMRFFKQEYGISNFDLIHDMFTVNRSKVVEFCQALADNGEQFNWNCSARTDCIDEELIALMAQVGCRGIFFGIETGSARLQKLTNKRLDLDEARSMIASTNHHGIQTAVSLITGFPEETRDDLRDTVHFLVDSLKYEHARPQLHILAPLAETPYQSQYRDQMKLDGIFSDMSYQGWRQDDVDRDLISRHPDIFPNFYALPTSLDRSYLKELRDFLLYGDKWCRWLLVALRRECPDVLTLFDEWLVWHSRHKIAQGDDSTAFYLHMDFQKAFLDFTAGQLLPKSGIQIALQTLIDFGRASITIKQCASTVTRGADALANLSEATITLSPATIPTVARGVNIIQLHADYKKIVTYLKEGCDLSEIHAQEVTVVARDGVQTPKDDLIQLSKSLATVFLLCDGKRQIQEIIEKYKVQEPGDDGIPADKSCIYGLAMLAQMGLIVDSVPVAKASPNSAFVEAVR